MSSESQQHCVIVGAGHAAAQLCASLIQGDWEGKLTVVGEEPHGPYHRPPLSKTQLNPEGEAELQWIRPAAFYSDNNIELLTGHLVTAINREAKTLTLDGPDATSLTYDTLVLATGSTHRKLPIPGVDHPRVSTLQTAAQAEAVRNQVPSAKSVVIIGAGFIGLEAASSLSKLGLNVTVLEFADRVLSRVTSPAVSAFFESLHKNHGIDLRTGAQATAIDEQDGQLTVQTKAGDAFPADFVLMGVGAAPNDQLAAAADLTTDNGIHVNEFNQTADESIYAVGDCANQHHPLYDTRMRLESVQNANDQAKTAAAAIAGQPKAHAALPWFWSDQYDVKFQIVGISTGYDQCIVRGTPEPGQSFSAWYFKENQLIAVDAINDPRAYAVAGKIIPMQGKPDQALVADASSELKAILQSAKES
ncbi:MAG: FAD-dependent oxidoreductase [Planctomycetota bacterium]